MAVDLRRRRVIATNVDRPTHYGCPQRVGGNDARARRRAKLGGSTEAGRRAIQCRPVAATNRSFERQGAAYPVSASAQPEPEPPRSSEPILIPKLRIDFADFPYLH